MIVIRSAPMEVNRFALEAGPLFFIALIGSRRDAPIYRFLKLTPVRDYANKGYAHGI
jgi:hypothetical protein